MDKNLFEQLLHLPLFQGIGRSDFNEIVAQIRLGLQKRDAGEILTESGDRCQSLHFVMQGTIYACQEGDERTYSLLERIEAPAVLQPERLYGLRPQYTRTVRALTPVQLLEVDKRAVSDVLFLYPTFRFNYLNMLSTQVQQARRRLWLRYPQSVAGRLVAFVADRALHPAGHKELRCAMEQMAEELGTSRLRCSRTLNALEARGLVALSRSRIEFPQFERLLQQKNWADLAAE